MIGGMGLSSRGNQSANILDQQKEMMRVHQAWSEIEMFVKRLGSVVLGMDEQRSNPGDAGRVHSTQQGVFEQRLAETGALFPHIDRANPFTTRSGASRRSTLPTVRL